MQEYGLSLTRIVDSVLIRENMGQWKLIFSHILGSVVGSVYFFHSSNITLYYFQFLSSPTLRNPFKTRTDTQDINLLLKWYRTSNLVSSSTTIRRNGKLALLIVQKTQCYCSFNRKTKQKTKPDTIGLSLIMFLWMSTAQCDLHSLHQVFIKYNGFLVKLIKCDAANFPLSLLCLLKYHDSNYFTAKFQWICFSKSLSFISHATDKLFRDILFGKPCYMLN